PRRQLLRSRAKRQRFAGIESNNQTSRMGSKCPEDRAVPLNDRYSSFMVVFASGSLGSSRGIEVVDNVTDDDDAEGVGDVRPPTSFSFSVSFSDLGFVNIFASMVIPSRPSLFPPISQYLTPPVVIAGKNSSRISAVISH